MLNNERDALKTQLEDVTATLAKMEAEKSSLLSEEAEALRRNVSRRDEEVCRERGRERGGLKGERGERGKYMGRGEREIRRGGGRKRRTKESGKKGRRERVSLLSFTSSHSFVSIVFLEWQPLVFSQYNLVYYILLY